MNTVAQDSACVQAPATEPTSVLASAPAADPPKQKVDISGPKKIKIVLVGDTSVGKSCLIRNYLENSFSDDYEPTVLDVYRGTKNVKKK